MALKLAEAFVQLSVRGAADVKADVGKAKGDLRDLQRQAAQVFASTRRPEERLKAGVSQLDRLRGLKEGGIDDDTHARASRILVTQFENEAGVTQRLNDERQRAAQIIARNETATEQFTRGQQHANELLHRGSLTVDQHSREMNRLQEVYDRATGRTQALADAQRQLQARMDAASHVVASTRTPDERLNQGVQDLRKMRSLPMDQGGIDDETFQRAHGKLIEQFERESGVTERLNQQRTEAVAIIRRHETAADGFLREQTRLNALLNSGEIDVQTYNKELARLATQYASTTPAAQQLAAAQQRGAAVTLQNETAGERWSRQLRELDGLYRMGSISSETFTRAQVRLRNQFIENSREQQRVIRGSSRMNMALQQASFGVQDFVQVIGPMGLSGAFRASANNMAQTLTLLSPAAGIYGGLAITLAAIGSATIFEGAKKNTDAVGELNDEIVKNIELRRTQAQEEQARRSEVEGFDAAGAEGDLSKLDKQLAKEQAGLQKVLETRRRAADQIERARARQESNEEFRRRERARVSTTDPRAAALEARNDPLSGTPRDIGPTDDLIRKKDESQKILNESIEKERKLKEQIAETEKRLLELSRRRNAEFTKAFEKGFGLRDPAFQQSQMTDRQRRELADEFARSLPAGSAAGNEVRGRDFGEQFRKVLEDSRVLKGEEIAKNLEDTIQRMEIDRISPDIREQAVAAAQKQLEELRSKGEDRMRDRSFGTASIAGLQTQIQQGLFPKEMDKAAKDTAANTKKANEKLDALITAVKKTDTRGKFSE